MKALLTILFSIIITSAFSQNFDYLQAYRRFTLAGRSVKGISNDTSWLIGSADSLVTQYAVKGYLDNRFGPSGNHIFGEEHQLLGSKYDNSDVLEFLEPLVEGNFIVSDSELTAAKLVFVSQSDIFNSWKRFSHGDNDPRGQGFINSSDTIPGIPLETNSWSYNAGTDQISSTLNSSSHIGFVSPLKYSNYNQSLTIGASSGDNDYISVIIAYVEDYNDMVKNNAYGLNPADFNWPINTTDRTIPNQHTLSLVRSRTSQGNFPFTVPVRYGIVYDLGKRSQQILINGESLTWNTNNDFGTGQSADVKVIRKGDSVFTYTTDWTDAPGGKGTLGKELKLDLSSLAITQKFRGSAAYGYGALSQANATYSGINNNIATNVIYDLRNGDKWIADNNGNYGLDTGSYFKDYGVRRFLYNPVTNKTFYMKYDHTYDLIGSGNIFNLTSDTTNTNNYYTTENNYYTTDSSFLDSRYFEGEGIATDPIRTTPINITSIGTIPYYTHSTHTLNIPTGGGGGTGGSTDTTSLSNRIDNKWDIRGNALAAGVNFLGSTNNVSLHFKTNNVEQAVLDSNGNFGLGDFGAGGKRPESHLHIVDAGGSAIRGITSEQNIGSSFGALLSLRKSRGSHSSPLAVQNTDYTAALPFYGYSGTGYLANVMIGAKVMGTVTTTSIPTDFFISTSPAGNVDPYNNDLSSGSVRLLVKSNGNTIIGNKQIDEPNAVLNVNSTTKGVLIPRMTKAQRDAIVNPPQGLMVFVTDGIPGYLSFYDGGWRKVTSTFD